MIRPQILIGKWKPRSVAEHRAIKEHGEKNWTGIKPSGNSYIIRSPNGEELRIISAKQIQESCPILSF